MRQRPDALIRIDDGEIYVRNEDGTYSPAYIATHPFYRWSYERLMDTEAFRHMTTAELTQAKRLT